MRFIAFSLAAVLLTCGFGLAVLTSRCLTLTGARGATLYTLSPVSDEADSGRQILFRLPPERRFDPAAKIESTKALDRASIARINHLLSNPFAYSDPSDAKLHFDARYAIVMVSGSNHLEVLIAPYGSETYVERFSPHQTRHAILLSSGSVWRALLRSFLPKDPELAYHGGGPEECHSLENPGST